jgi:Ca2+-binding RTX toxin-like protein
MRAAIVSSRTALAASVVLLTISMELANAQVPPTCEGKSATIYVQDGKIMGGPNDGQTYEGILIGTPGDDVIVGTSGNDIIQGMGGDDTICPGPGDDSVA